MTELTTLQQGQILLEGTANFLHRAYLPDLHQLEVEEVNSSYSLKDYRLFHLQKIVYDCEEDIYEKLVTIFTTVHNLQSKTFLLLKSDGSTINFHLGVVASDATSVAAGFRESLKGVLPGTKLESYQALKIKEVLEDTFNPKNKPKQVITSVSGLPSLKTEEQYIQGLEKFIEAMNGRKFSTVLIADPIYSEELTVRRQGYHELASGLSSYEKTTMTMSESEAAGLSDTLTHTLTQTVSHSLTKTETTTQTTSQGSNKKDIKGTFNKGKNLVNKGVEFAKNQTSTITNISALGAITAGIAPATGVATAGVSMVATGIAAAPVAAAGVALGAIGLGLSLVPTVTENTSEAKAEGQTVGQTTADGTSNSIAQGTTYTKTKNKGVQVEYKNYQIKSILDKIDSQLERLDMSENYGMWNFAAYFLSEDAETTKVAASAYQSLIRGETSYLENSAMNTWYPHEASYEVVKRTLAQIEHPQFKIDANFNHLSAATLIHTRELAIAFGLPRKSITGLPVIETAEFGRDVRKPLNHAEKRAVITLGNIYHMGEEGKEPVELDVESLSMHTFVTGTTGSGKSNTIYHMLAELHQKNIKFLVIEPAKGEYSQVFGGYEDVAVYGTNEKFTPLLQINPFYFPTEIHVLEHIDQLIEIFNASWPMYAAMPAILKEAVERVYVRCGWNLQQSYNYEQQSRYPNLGELVEALKEVIEQSSYAEEVKSNYTGSLVTRIQSLRNGIAGKLLVSDEISPTILFEQNCIVDLSRVSSAETKALLMGILFMRLKEHRMATTKGTNQSLKHVTVLEEAHHLLKRVVATGEGNQLQAQSVEMIANSMAEMRTYGQGFIIVDQSPNLLDLAAIRNTNTKIIMRLPEGQDRQDIGQAAALTPLQIEEIPKLEQGVAVVYQNDWLQPVLSKVTHFKEAKEKPLTYTFDEKAYLKEKRVKQTRVLQSLFDDNIKPDYETVQHSPILNEWKAWYQQGKYTVEARRAFIYEYMNGKHCMAYVKQANTLQEMHERLSRILRYEMDSMHYELTHKVMYALFYIMDENIANEWKAKFTEKVR